MLAVAAHERHLLVFIDLHHHMMVARTALSQARHFQPLFIAHEHLQRVAHSGRALHVMHVRRGLLV
jgi:hypothetical protein